MPLKTLTQILSDCFQNHTALPSFNIDSFEIYQAVELAVADTNLPCLVQLTPNEDQFIQAERLLMLVKKAQIDGLPIYLNMDHGHDLTRLAHLSDLGFDLVHFDGSSLPFEDNLTKSIEFVANVHPGTLVEVEFSQINLVDSGSPDSLTDPQAALNFITQTKADLLAVSIGNRHGNNPDLPENINLDLLSQIHRILPNTFLTLHGGSGISADQIRSAIDLGVVKININTDLRLQFKQSLNRVLAEINSEKLYEYLRPVVADVQVVVKQKLIQFHG